MTRKPQQALVIPDLHVPFHDKKYVKLIDKIITEVKPNYLVQLGDMVDFFQISKFARSLDERSTCYEDLMEARIILDRWDKLMPEGSEIHLLEGNHEARLLKYYSKRAPELHEMVKSIPDVYGLNVRNKFGKNKWTWHQLNRWDSCKIGDVVYHHGTYFNQHTAGSNLTKYPCPKFIQGHNHRILYASGGSNKWSATLGHGLDISQIDYLCAPNLWGQAFGLVTYFDGIGSLEIVEVVNDTCVLRGIKL